MQLKFPDFRQLTIHDDILDMIDMYVRMFNQWPDLNELMLMNVDAFHAYFAYQQGVQYFTDLAKRPANMR